MKEQLVAVHRELRKVKKCGEKRMNTVTLLLFSVNFDASNLISRNLNQEFLLD
jgi:hypothetical protein